MRNRGYHKAGMGCIIDEINEILGKCRKPLRECPAFVLSSRLVCFGAVSFRLDSSQRLQESEGGLLPAAGQEASGSLPEVLTEFINFM